MPVAGDEKAVSGFLLTGKPPRGFGRVVELILGRGGRNKTVMQARKELLEREKPDMVWAHNIAGGEKWGWSIELLSCARKFCPVLWTLHDMWALGDSSESYWEEDEAVEGEKWKGAGKNNVEGGRGQGARVDGLKGSRVERVYRESGKYPVAVTAPSKWLTDLTKKITGQDCVFLPNPIDLKTFSPGDRIAARRRFGLPEEGLVVLAGADSLTDPRKGFDLLREAWGKAQRHGATLALFGRHGENRPGERYLGNLTSDEEMVAAYRAADLYVHPARMENAPCTIQESLACGTPVLAFAVGGIPEMVIPGKTGFLAERVEAQSLGSSLAEALADAGRLRAMRVECRTVAEQVWDPDALADSFREVVPGVPVISGR